MSVWRCAKYSGPVPLVGMLKSLEVYTSSPTVRSEQIESESEEESEEEDEDEEEEKAASGSVCWSLGVGEVALSARHGGGGLAVAADPTPLGCAEVEEGLSSKPRPPFVALALVPIGVAAALSPKSPTLWALCKLRRTAAEGEGCGRRGGDVVGVQLMSDTAPLLRPFRFLRWWRPPAASASLGMGAP